jgi:hypothetical protein
VGSTYFYGGAWQPFRAYGGLITGAPALASPATDILDVFVRGLFNDALFHRRHDVDPAGTYRVVDYTRLSSSPAATSDQDGHLFLFAKIGNDLHVRSVTAATTMAQDWGRWSSIGPVALPTPPAPPAAPPPPPAPLQTLTPRLTWTHKVARRSTRLSGLRLSRIPAGATVQVMCSKGCSAKRWTTRPKRSSVSLSRFTRRPLRVGRSIRVQVTKPGTIGSVKTLTIRARKAPRVIDRCLPPGARAPQRCAT